MQVEAVVRTVCTYTFAEHHQGTSDYLVQANFCNEDEFREFGLKNYIDNLLKLQGSLYKISATSRNEAIVHHRKRHGGVPLWVLSKALTFGAIEHFFHLMKPKERQLVCKRIVEATGRAGKGNPYFDAKDARRSLDAIVKFRNKCAHDERLYCAKIGHRDPVVDFASMLELVEPYLCRSDYDDFLSDIMLTIVSYNDQSSFATHVLEESGIDRIFDQAMAATKRRLERPLSPRESVKFGTYRP